MAKISEYTIHGPPAQDSSPSQHIHRSLTIRREPKVAQDLRAQFRDSQDNDVPEVLEQLKNAQRTIPTTPVLPPTPPTPNGESTGNASEEPSSDVAAFRSTLATPINQNSPPTPDHTPPRDRRLPFARPFLGTQISLASTRAESFRTAKEDFGSDDDSLAISPDLEHHALRARSYHSRLADRVNTGPQSGLARSALTGDGDVITPRVNSHEDSPTPELLQEEEHTNDRQSMFEPPRKPVSSSIARIVESYQFAQGERQGQGDMELHAQRQIHESPASASIRRGQSLRDRLEAAERFSPSASTEKFASIIGWTNSVGPDAAENKRSSGISAASTVSAIVIDSSPLPRRPTTLRKIAKNDSLRSASSPLPNSNRTSQGSSNDSPHRLVHKKVRLNNDHRFSVGSGASRSQSLSSSAVLPKPEIIRVAVIPERASSLQSSASSSRRHSITTISHKTQSRKGSDNLPPTSWQRKRTGSESQSQDRGRDEQQDLVIPPRSSSLSAPASRNTSRANSITSDHIRIRRLEAETDLRKTLERMESDRLVSSLKKMQNGQPDGESQSAEAKSTPDQPSIRASVASTPSKRPRQVLAQPNEYHEQPINHFHAGTVTPGTSEWAALRPISVLDTPFSQPSYQSASPEINEARAINFFPHNNHSLQIIEPNLTQESRAVQEVRKDDYLKDETQSPLRNPRRPPEPPRVTVIPPSPSTEFKAQFGAGPPYSQHSSVKRRPSQPRSESFVKALTRGLSLKNARNRKADQDLDGNLHPFWRPQPFWGDEDNDVHEKSEYEGRFLARSGPVNNSLGFSQDEPIITGPVSLIRRISERRRQNRALVKQRSQSSLARLRASQKLYQSPIMGINMRFMGLREMQDRLLYARQRKEDERARSAKGSAQAEHWCERNLARFIEQIDHTDLTSNLIVVGLATLSVTSDPLSLEVGCLGAICLVQSFRRRRHLDLHQLRYRPAQHPDNIYALKEALFTLAATQSPQSGAIGAAGLSGSPPLLHKRNASVAGLDSSPATPSLESPEPQNGDDVRGGKRGQKRACNECRQQKLRCDVVQEPFQTCSRCTRLRLECKIEDNFKRIGKRSRNAEMEREIVDLRKQVAEKSAVLRNAGLSNGISPSMQNFAHDAAAGLLDLRSGLDKTAGSRGPIFKRLGPVGLTADRIQELHTRFFTFFHPFLPFLQPEKSADQYYQRSPLLFWTVMSIGARHYRADSELFVALSQPLTKLIWETIAEVPQNYHHVKALILLCAWPLPTSSTSTDPTFMYCGLMIQIALQIGLHRPSHAQDFSKFRVELREAELQDRVVVWSVCNIVAQRIATAYGQPPLTIYDWTLGPKPIENNPNYELPAPVLNRLLIEKFVDRVSQALYMNDKDPVGLTGDKDRGQFIKLLMDHLEHLEDQLRQDTSLITRIYLKAAVLHMRLSAFFSPPTLESYREDLLELYHATTDFLETCLSLESESVVSLPSSYSHGLSLCYGTNYIFHMMLAAGFSLLKLMHNFLSQHELDMRGASDLLTRTLFALRSMSTSDDDLAERLAEVLAQVWKSGRVRAQTSQNIGDEGQDDSLQLKVKCRMSVSLVFDSVWRWRKNFRFNGGKPSEVRQLNAALQVATRPSSRTGMREDSSPTANNHEALPMMEPAVVPGMAGMSTGMLDDYGMDYGQANYEVFDPLNWMLDGIVDFPYNFNPSTGTMDQSGLPGLGNGV